MKVEKMFNKDKIAELAIEKEESTIKKNPPPTHTRQIRH
jgi:hypothetical protein